MEFPGICSFQIDQIPFLRTITIGEAIQIFEFFGLDAIPNRDFDEAFTLFDAYIFDAKICVLVWFQIIEFSGIAQFG